MGVGNAITMSIQQSNYALITIKGKLPRGSHGPNNAFWVQNAQEFTGQVRSALAQYYERKGQKALDATGQVACRMPN
jgi:hypothetical protein